MKKNKFHYCNNFLIPILNTYGYQILLKYAICMVPVSSLPKMARVVVESSLEEPEISLQFVEKALKEMNAYTILIK